MFYSGIRAARAVRCGIDQEDNTGGSEMEKVTDRVREEEDRGYGGCERGVAVKEKEGTAIGGGKRGRENR